MIFILAMGTWGAYLAWYATRFRLKTAPHTDEGPAVHPVHVTNWKPSDIGVLAALNGGMTCLVLGAVFLHWDLSQFSALFVGVGFVAGLAGGLGWRGTAMQFAEGSAG